MHPPAPDLITMAGLLQYAQDAGKGLVVWKPVVFDQQMPYATELLTDVQEHYPLGPLDVELHEVDVPIK